MPKKYLLKLYILGNTPVAQKAIYNATKVCEDKLAGMYELDVIDLKKHIQLAEDEKIFATPTLEKKLPLPLRRVIGDLSHTQNVLVGLNIITGNQSNEES